MRPPGKLQTTSGHRSRPSFRGLSAEGRKDSSWQIHAGKVALFPQGIGECDPTRHITFREDYMPSSQRRFAIDRRTILKSGAVIAAAQITSPFIINARGETPVRIGLVDPLTGVYAALAQNEVVGAKYAVEELNKKGGILGRPVELLVEDSANDVGTGVQKTRKLIERDQVSFIIGDVNSGIAIAMAQVTSEKKVLHIVSGGHSDVVTGPSCSWNVYRVCNSTTMDSAAIAQTLIEKFGKKWYFLTPDYAYGH